MGADAQSSTEAVDSTELAGPLLRCVQEVRERFGIAYIIRVLRGSRDERIRRAGHDKLPSYRSGYARGRPEWHDIAQRLIEGGYIDIARDDFNVVRLTERGRSALAGKERVMLALEEEMAVAAIARPAAAFEQGDEALFQRLRAVRKRIADAQRVAAFVIFYDSTLRSMAAERPATRDQLLRIAGVTERKLLDFGELFLSILTETDQPKPVSLPAARPSATPRPAPPLGSQLPETVLATLALFRAGDDVAAIANQRGLKPRTVHEQLARAIEMGEKLDMNRLVAPDRLRVIEAAVADLGPALLKPLKDRLGDGYGYDEIRIVQALVVWRARGGDAG